MVVAGDHDVEAAEALGALDLDDRIAAALAEELARPKAPTPSCMRLVQAPAELNGPVVRATLESLAADPDRGVALTAGALLQR